MSRADPPAVRIGPYEVVGHLGVGGMGCSAPATYGCGATLPSKSFRRRWARDGSSIVIGFSQTSGDIMLAERSR